MIFLCVKHKEGQPFFIFNYQHTQPTVRHGYFYHEIIQEGFVTLVNSN